MRQLYFIFSFFILLTSCSTPDGSTSQTIKRSIPLHYAENFKLDSLSTGILLTIGEKTGPKKYYFLSKNPPHFLQKNWVWIKTPVHRIVTLAGTDIGMLSALKEENRICGVSNQRTVYNKTVLHRIKKHHVADFGDQEHFSLERMLASNAQVLSYSSFGKDFPHEKELLKAGMVCLPILDWKESHPLGKAEWIKVYGYLCNNPNKANDYFRQTMNNYNDLKSQSTGLHKKLSVFSGNQTGEIWFCPGGESYEARLIADAGGNYLYKHTKGTGSLSLSPEKVLTDNRHSSVWINPGANSCADLLQKQPKAHFFDAFKSKKVYCYSNNMNNYWENAACRPDKVLSDLQVIFLNGDPKNLYFYAPLQ